MAENVTLQPTGVEVAEERKSARTVMAGTIAEGIAGGGAVVLSIVGLSRISPDLMLNIATLAMGAALLLEGGAVSMRFSKLLRETRSARLTEEAEFGVGVSAEFLGGVAGIVFGILSLAGVASATLIPIAVLVFGATLILGSGATVRLNALDIEGSKVPDRIKRVTHEAVTAAAGVQLLLGLAGVVLGILALIGTDPQVLCLAALLAVGVSGFLDAAAITARMASLYHY